MSGVDKAFDEFLKVFEDKATRHQVKSTVEQRIVDAKNVRLQPLRALLQRLMDLHLVVHHANHYNRQVPSQSSTPQLFEVYENQSSPLWSPGISLFFDHPAQVEIAIPNDQGPNTAAVVMRSSSHHPESHLLDQHFATVDAACLALSQFLARNTVRVERVPLKP